jgi:hypothetical protein
MTQSTGKSRPHAGLPGLSSSAPVRMRQRVVLVAIGAVALGLLAGCGGGSGTKTTTAGVTSTGRTTASRRTPAGTQGVSSSVGSAALNARPVVEVCHGGPGGIPSSAVVRICANTITKAMVDHSLAVASKPGVSAKAVVPDPPKYTACVANLQANLPKLAKEHAKLTAAQLRVDCGREYRSLLPSVLNGLILREWGFAEAQFMHISVSDAEVHQGLIQLSHEHFPKPGEFEKYLKNSGQSMSDVLLHIKSDLTAKKLQRTVMKSTPKVTHAQIQKYYNENPSSFSSQQTFAQVEASIEQKLTSYGQQTALSEFLKEFKKKWKAQTACRVGYVVDDCQQFKAPKRTTTAGPTRTVPFNVTAHLHLRTKNGSTLEQRGTASGTVNGTIDISLKLVSSSRLIAVVKIYQHGGSLLGGGTASYEQSVTLTTFSGTLAITRGTGSYRRARASSMKFTGSMQRPNGSMTVQLSGKLSV